jgi:hypothetical protein
MLSAILVLPAACLFAKIKPKILRLEGFHLLILKQKAKAEPFQKDKHNLLDLSQGRGAS